MTLFARHDHRRRNNATTQIGTLIFYYGFVDRQTVVGNTRFCLSIEEATVK